MNLSVRRYPLCSKIRFDATNTVHSNYEYSFKLLRTGLHDITVLRKASFAKSSYSYVSFKNPETLHRGTRVRVVNSHIRPSTFAPEPLLCCRLVLVERPAVRLTVGTGGKGGGRMSEYDFIILPWGPDPVCSPRHHQRSIPEHSGQSEPSHSRIMEH